MIREQPKQSSYPALKGDSVLQSANSRIYIAPGKADVSALNDDKNFPVTLKYSMAEGAGWPEDGRAAEGRSGDAADIAQFVRERQQQEGGQPSPHHVYRMEKRLKERQQDLADNLSCLKQRLMKFTNRNYFQFILVTNFEKDRLVYLIRGL